MTTIDDINTTSLMMVTVQDLQRAIEELQGQVQAIGMVAEAMTCSLKAFSDLYIELTSKAHERRFVEKAVLRAERLVARTKLPIWFWRNDPEVSIDTQLKTRIEYLNENKYSIDDMWTLLNEFINEFTTVNVASKRLEALLESVLIVEED